MTLVDRYISRQVIVTTGYAVLVLSLVLVMGNLYKQVRPLLVEQHAPLSLVMRFILNVLPFSLMFTIPWGFLSAILLVFGRLSTDQEITAFRVGGLSLVRLAMPVFAIALVLSGLCLWINLNVVPKAQATMTDMLYEQIKENPESLLDPNLVQSRFKNQKLFVEKRDEDSLKGFHLYQISDQAETGASSVEAYIHADRVSLVVDEEKKQLRLKLSEVFIESKKKDGADYLFAKEAEPWLLDFGEGKQKKVRASAMSNEEIRIYLKDHDELPLQKRVDFQMEIVKRFTYSMACFSFACVAIPLGLSSRRKDNSSGLVLSLGIGMFYFLFTMAAENFETAWIAMLALWTPNLLCCLLGIYLFKKARYK